MLKPESAPSLYSFITYRKEVEGGFLFNPYLMAELSLDDFESGVVELCDGNTPVGIMGVELARLFRTDRASAEQRLATTLAKFTNYFALKWFDGEDMKGPPTDAPLAAAPGRSNECSIQKPMSGCLSAPLSVLWEVTHACNLSCMHCLSSCGDRKPNELSTSEAKSLIDEMAALRVFWFTLGGGEPLVRGDVYELIAHATERDLCVRLTTNGFAVTEDTLCRLSDLNVFSVQISVDGQRETHDRFRGRPGAFDRAIQALNLFREAGYTTLVTVSANAMNASEIPDLARYLIEIGVNSVKIGPCASLGRAVENRIDLALSTSQMRELSQQMRLLQDQKNGDTALQLDGLFPFLFEPEPDEAGITDQQCGPGCSAGISQAVVSYDGNVYPCPYIRDKSAGNLREQSLAEIWHNEDYFGPLRTFDPSHLKGKCGTCGYRPQFCTGGCRGAAYAAQGDLYAEDPNCWRSQVCDENPAARAT